MGNRGKWYLSYMLHVEREGTTEKEVLLSATTEEAAISEASTKWGEVLDAMSKKGNSFAYEDPEVVYKFTL